MGKIQLGAEAHILSLLCVAEAVKSAPSGRLGKLQVRDPPQTHAHTLLPTEMF